MNITVKSWNVVVLAPEPVHVLTNRDTAHGLEVFGRQRHLKDQPAAVGSFHEDSDSRGGKFRPVLDAIELVSKQPAPLAGAVPRQLCYHACKTRIARDDSMP